MRSRDSTRFQAPVMIMGAPRSGTSLLHRILRGHPGFVSTARESQAVWQPLTEPSRHGWQGEMAPAGLTGRDIDGIHRQLAKLALPAEVWRRADARDVVAKQQSRHLSRWLLRPGYRGTGHGKGPALEAHHPLAPGGQVRSQRPVAGAAGDHIPGCPLHPYRAGARGHAELDGRWLARPESILYLGATGTPGDTGLSLPRVELPHADGMASDAVTGHWRRWSRSSGAACRKASSGSRNASRRIDSCASVWKI